tara:strand:- start:323 stop:571 length:249 start_codon:yes stop_codon:yes gene_type:complete
VRKDKEIERQTINEKIDAFLKKGGKIKKIPAGMSGTLSSTHMNMPINHFKTLNSSEARKKISSPVRAWKKEFGDFRVDENPK